MRFYKILAFTGVLALASASCADLEVTNLNDPDLERAVNTPSDVETLISGAFSGWWQAGHRGYGGGNLSTAADAHSSSWGNWGMRDAGTEPRIPFNNDPTYSYNNVAEDPWGLSYRSLAGVRDGIQAIEDRGLVITTAGGEDVTERAVAFAYLVQALTLSNLAVYFDQAFVVDETTDLEGISLQPYDEVWQAALAKYDAAIQTAEAAPDFTIPAAWVGYDTEWTRDEFVQFAQAFRARYRTQVPRSVEARQNVDWNAVLSDLSEGLPFDYAPFYDGTTWAWDRQKLHTGPIDGWARIDYRTVGPADVSGAYQTWLAAAPDDKLPFEIVTPDRRVTGETPTSDGTLIRYIGNSPFPASRGIYHFSDYIDDRWAPLVASGYVGNFPDFVDKEVDFLRAEAWYQLNGNNEQTMEVVNQYRANGELPAFTDPNGVAPGGDECVPQNADGSCAGLFEALQYEKRIELFHYGFGTEYFDDRGWGDLVTDTYLHLPVPGSELLLLLMDIYTFGGDAGGAAPVSAATPLDFMSDTSDEALRYKVEAFEEFDARMAQPIEPGTAH